MIINTPSKTLTSTMSSIPEPGGQLAPAAASRSSSSQVQASLLPERKKTSTASENGKSCAPRFRANNAVMLKPGESPVRADGTPFDSIRFKDPEEGDVMLNGTQSQAQFKVQDKKTGYTTKFLNVKDGVAFEGGLNGGAPSGKSYRLRDGTPCDKHGNPLPSSSSSSSSKSYQLRDGTPCDKHGNPLQPSSSSSKSYQPRYGTRYDKYGDLLRSESHGTSRDNEKSPLATSSKQKGRNISSEGNDLDLAKQLAESMQLSFSPYAGKAPSRLAHAPRSFAAANVSSRNIRIEGEFDKEDSPHSEAFKLYSAADRNIHESQLRRISERDDVSLKMTTTTDFGGPADEPIFGITSGKVGGNRMVVDDARDIASAIQQGSPLELEVKLNSSISTEGHAAHTINHEISLHARDFMDVYDEAKRMFRQGRSLSAVEAYINTQQELANTLGLKAHLSMAGLGQKKNSWTNTFSEVEDGMKSRLQGSALQELNLWGETDIRLQTQYMRALNKGLGRKDSLSSKQQNLQEAIWKYMPDTRPDRHR